MGKYDDLETTAQRVYKYLRERIGDTPQFVRYTEIAEEVGKKPRGQGSNDRKSLFSSLSDGNFTVRNADFSRSDQHSHRIRHRRTGAPDFLRNFRISHEGEKRGRAKERARKWANMTIWKRRRKGYINTCGNE